MAGDDEQEPPDGPSGPDVISRAAAEISRLLATPLPGGLYLVATPIGNLGDITLRALSVLARADVIYCEDTRHSRTLASHFSLTAPLKPYHEHNAESERPRVLAALRNEKRIALISDAGTPLVSDPGFKLVREAIEAGHRVESLPGPSALLAGLTSAGLPTNAFLFAGFLPPKTTARRSRLGEFKDISATLVFFEAPSRLADSLADMAAVLGPRPAAIARELTKLHEEIARGPLDELAVQYAQGSVKGEIVIVVAPPPQLDVADAVIVDALALALATMSLRDAAKAVSTELGVPKARVYDLGLQIRRDAP